LFHIHGEATGYQRSYMYVGYSIINKTFMPLAFEYFGFIIMVHWECLPENMKEIKNKLVS